MLMEGFGEYKRLSLERKSMLCQPCSSFALKRLYRPEIVVQKRFQQPFRRNSLSIVHVTYSLISIELQGSCKVGSEPLEGSSRRTRFTTIPTSRSENQPFGRNQVFVWTADAGIKKKAAVPTDNVMIPSIKKSHLVKILVRKSCREQVKISPPPAG
jgi:hypothetical protein